MSNFCVETTFKPITSENRQEVAGSTGAANWWYFKEKYFKEKEKKYPAPTSEYLMRRKIAWCGQFFLIRGKIRRCGRKMRPLRTTEAGCSDPNICDVNKCNIQWRHHSINEPAVEKGFLSRLNKGDVTEDGGGLAHLHLRLERAQEALDLISSTCPRGSRRNFCFGADGPQWHRKPPGRVRGVSGSVTLYTSTRSLSRGRSFGITGRIHTETG